MKWCCYLCSLFHLLLSYVLQPSKLYYSIRDAVRYVLGLAGPSGFGSRSTGEQVTQGLSLSSTLTAIVTGATSGIGAETARVLAKRGVRLVIPARNMKRAAEVRERILRESLRAEIVIMELNLASFDSIQSFCSNFVSLGFPLNILINNAGRHNQRLELSEDKFEMTFATNYLGHFLLTELLLEKMVQTASITGIEGRIINVSSVIHGWVRRECFQFSDMLNPKVYNGTRAYAQSKLANIMHAKEMARQLRERKAKVTVNAVHPGIVKTGIIRDKGLMTELARDEKKTDLMFFLVSSLLKSTSQGASTTCYATLSSQLNGVTGRYFSDCNEIRCSILASDEKEAQKLWKETQTLIQKRLRQSHSA